MNTRRTLDMAHWQSGSIGVWGAVDPIYNTARFSEKTGVHVHARRVLGGMKSIDKTFDRVFIKNWKEGEDSLVVDASTAIHYMVAAIFELKTKYIRCPACKYPHLDEGWFSVNPHRKHLCMKCNKVFFDFERSIGNPLGDIEMPPDALVSQQMPMQALDIMQSAYAGGIQLWGSNPAIVWRNQNRENKGIHVHAYNEDGRLVFDESVVSLTVDGLPLDVDQVRYYMAQSTVEHLRQCVTDIVCPHCNAYHFDKGHWAYTPHQEHLCEQCGRKFHTPDGVGVNRKPLDCHFGRDEVGTSAFIVGTHPFSSLLAYFPYPNDPHSLCCLYDQRKCNSRRPCR